MHGVLSIAVIALVVALTPLSASPVLAQIPPDDPSVSACTAGAGYASGCDVDQHGDIDILDVQLTAGRWNSSGVYTSGHTHWGPAPANGKAGPLLVEKRNVPILARSCDHSVAHRLPGERPR